MHVCRRSNTPSKLNLFPLKILLSDYEQWLINSDQLPFLSSKLAQNLPMILAFLSWVKSLRVISISPIQKVPTRATRVYPQPHFSTTSFHTYTEQPNLILAVSLHSPMSLSMLRLSFLTKHFTQPPHRIRENRSLPPFCDFSLDFRDTMKFPSFLLLPAYPFCSPLPVHPFNANPWMLEKPGSN